MKVLGFLLSFPSGMLGAWVLSKMWLWFVAPLGIVPITWTHAWGLWLIPSMVLSGVALGIGMSCYSDDAEVKFPSNSRMLIGSLVMPFVYLGMLLTSYCVWTFGMPH